jgi:hypothetical protein
MSTIDVHALTDEIKQRSQFVEAVLSETSKVVVGQKILLERILIALLCDGHVLLEGLPGLAKTLTIKTFADVIHADFQRIQFTPDLLPADLVGTILRRKKDRFLPIWFSPMKSIARRQKCRARFSKQWENIRSRSATRLIR